MLVGLVEGKGVIYINVSSRQNLNVPLSYPTFTKYEYNKMALLLDNGPTNNVFVGGEIKQLKT